MNRALILLFALVLLVGIATVSAQFYGGGFRGGYGGFRGGYGGFRGGYGGFRGGYSSFRGGYYRGGFYG